MARSLDPAQGERLLVSEALQNLIPTLSAEEREGLKESIKREGCRDALVAWNNTIVDGHNRYEICVAEGIPFNVVERKFSDENDAKLWIIDNQFSRRNLPEIDRIELAEQFREIESAMAKARQLAGTLPSFEGKVEDRHGRETDAKIAEKAKSSREKVRKVRKIKEKAPDKLEDIRRGDSSINAAYKDVVKEERRTKKEEERRAAAARMESLTFEERIQLVHADFKDALGDLPEESVDLILTDPPYEEAAMPLYSDLAELASTCLKLGGICAVMSGQSYLPEVMRRLADSLTYHWTIAYLTPGGQAPHIFQRNVNTFWKPVLVFVKSRYDGECFGDVAKSAVNDNDKRFHYWGQSESGTSDLMNRLSEPGDMVVDPFLGGGTTAIAAAASGRRFLGCDSNRSAFETAAYRLKEFAQQQESA